VSIAVAKEARGRSPLYLWAFLTTLIFRSGCPPGHMASIVHPALAKAMASREVGNQWDVAEMRTTGFTFACGLLKKFGCLLCISEKGEKIRSVKHVAPSR